MDADERVIGILESKQGILDEAAEKLLECKVIEGDELKALAQGVLQSGTPEDDSGTSQNNHALATLSSIKGFQNPICWFVTI